MMPPQDAQDKEHNASSITDSFLSTWTIPLQKRGRFLLTFLLSLASCNTFYYCYWKENNFSICKVYWNIEQCIVNINGNEMCSWIKIITSLFLFPHNVHVVKSSCVSMKSFATTENVQKESPFNFSHINALFAFQFMYITIFVDAP